MLPDQLTDEVRATLQAIISDVEALTIENRVYAQRLDGGDLPDDVRVMEDAQDHKYYREGTKPMYSDIVVAVEGEDARIAAEWNSTRSHWRERDFAGEFYDICEEHGCSRPKGNPTVGVQFSSDGNVAVENVYPNAVSDE